MPLSSKAGVLTNIICQNKTEEKKSSLSCLSKKERKKVSEALEFITASSSKYKMLSESCRFWLNHKVLSYFLCLIHKALHRIDHIYPFTLTNKGEASINTCNKELCPSYENSNWSYALVFRAVRVPVTYRITTSLSFSDYGLFFVFFLNLTLTKEINMALNSNLVSLLDMLFPGTFTLSEWWMKVPEVDVTQENGIW